MRGQLRCKQAAAGGADSVDESSTPSLQDFIELVKPSSGEPPAVLYHYTSAESLKRILENRYLLATHFEFTNDPTELRYGQDLVVAETRRTRDSLGPDMTWAKPILNRVLAKIEREGFHDDMPTFVTCFSADGDNLGQWRAYAQDGRGYAIGFDTTTWEYNQSNGAIGTVLVECLYEPSQMEKEIREQHRSILGLAAKLKAQAGAVGPRFETDLQVEKAFYLVGAYATLRLKNRGFMDEKEWRLVALPGDSERGDPNGQCVREIGGLFAPAIKLRLCDEKRTFPLCEIVVGPCHAQEGRTKSAEYGVRELLRLENHHLPKDGAIKSSSIPYRSRARHV
jgi:hypothetical protein